MFRLPEFKLDQAEALPTIGSLQRAEKGQKDEQWGHNGMLTVDRTHACLQMFCKYF